jgi:hypothetical protein
MTGRRKGKERKGKGKRGETEGPSEDKRKQTRSNEQKSVTLCNLGHAWLTPPSLFPCARLSSLLRSAAASACSSPLPPSQCPCEWRAGACWLSVCCRSVPRPLSVSHPVARVASVPALFFPSLPFPLCAGLCVCVGFAPDGPQDGPCSAGLCCVVLPLRTGPRACPGASREKAEATTGEGGTARMRLAASAGAGVSACWRFRRPATPRRCARFPLALSKTHNSGTESDSTSNDAKNQRCAEERVRCGDETSGGTAAARG